MQQDLDENFQEEVKILLKKNLAVSEENNRMIRSMRNAARFHSFIRILILIVIVIAAVWGYSHFKPYFDQAKSTYDSYQQTQNKLLDTVNKYIPGK